MAPTVSQEAMATTPTSRATKGFTLIELTVIIIVVALIATIVLPNFVAVRKGQEARNFVSEVRTLAVRARNEALAHGETLAMTYDGTNQQLFVAVEAGEVDENQEIANLKLPEGTTLQSFKTGTNDTSDANWKVHFYPDGRSEGGGFEINQSNLLHSFVVRDDGSNQMLAGDYPDQSNEKWQAGDYARRQ